MEVRAILREEACQLEERCDIGDAGGRGREEGGVVTGDDWESCSDDPL